MKSIMKNTGGYVITILVGLALGWLIFSPDPASDRSGVEVAHQETLWTCSMHPHIQQDHEGDCPICGMDLIPLNESGDSNDFSVVLSDNARRQANISTYSVSDVGAIDNIVLSGKIMPDERKMSRISSRVSGRIESLNVNFTGQKVRRGQVLARVYSPELVSAQKELKQAANLKTSRPELYAAVQQKLKLWNLSEKQIKEMENSDLANYNIPIVSPISGTITVRNVTVGDYVKEGSAMFEVVDLSSVWAVFDVYESDLAWVEKGSAMNISVKSYPGRSFDSKITFIEPVMDPVSRVVKVRTELSNKEGMLKPEMLASATVSVDMEEMDLMNDWLIIPRSAVLWTGKRSVVYVMDTDNPNVFSYREIVLGKETDDYYMVVEGLEKGEVVASNGVFKIDAAAQLQGKSSMMNTPEIENEEHSQAKQGAATHTHFPDVSAEFKDQFLNAITTYTTLNEALVNSDISSANTQLAALSQQIDAIDMKLLEGDAHIAWMDQLTEIQKFLELMKKENDLSMIRKEYADLTAVFYSVIKTYGIQKEGLYYQYCPMALENQGAYWLSNKEEILNPYYGDMMLNCGETIEAF